MRKVVVIGLGSMGRRRIRLMRTLQDVPELVGVDVSQDRRDAVGREFGIATSSTLAEAIETYRPEAAFVCTSPLGHEGVVMQCLDAGLHVFMELNLSSDWYDRAETLAAERNCKLFPSSTFLYRKEMKYLADVVRGRKVNYIYHSGQYLPDWHPWESYKNFFVSDRRTNACREILAIELPWLVRTFGDVCTLSVMKGHDSSLDIDFSDNYMIGIRHAGGSKGIFCQDVLSRKAVRRLEVYSEDLHIFWDGTPQSLMRYDTAASTLVHVSLYDEVSHEVGYGESIVENAYRDEIVAFFDFVDRNQTPRYTLADDGRILSLVDEIEGGSHG